MRWSGRLAAAVLGLTIASPALAQPPAPPAPATAPPAAGETDERVAGIKALDRESLAALRAGDSVRAVELARQGRDLAVQQGLAKPAADIRRLLARALSSLGDHAAALGELEAAEAFYAATGDEVNRIGTVANRGIVMRLLGDLTEALRLQRQVLAYKEKHGTPDEIAVVLNNMGIVEMQRGNHRAAAESFERSVALTTEEDSRVIHLGNLGLVYGSQGDFDLSLRYIKEAGDAAAKLGDHLSATIWRLDYGATLNDLERWEEALASLRAGLAAMPPGGGFRAEAGFQNEIGRALINLGRVDEAAAAYDAGLARARAGSEPEHLVLALCGVAAVRSKRGANGLAEASAREALAEAERVGAPALIAPANETLGDVLRAAGRLPEARAAYDGAIAVVERVRLQTAGADDEQLKFFEQQLPPYHAIVRILVEQGAFAEAVSYMERARGRVLVDVLQRGRTTLPGALTPAEREEERRLGARLVATGVREARARTDGEKRTAVADAQRARDDAAAFRLRMLARYPRTRVASGDVRFAGLPAAAPIVADGATAVLVYTVTPTETFLATITRSRDVEAPALKVATLPIGREALAARVRAFRGRVAARDLGVDADARALFDLLLAPAALPDGIRRLVVAPDASLWELPFQALRGADDRYLVERAAVAYAPSLTALASTRPADTEVPRALLALGNPVLPATAALPPLTEAARQVEAIARRFPPGQREIRIGAAATEAAVRAEAGRSRILHIAAHGTLDAASPMYSALLLTPDPAAGDDGRLEARELVDLDLPAALVVLSACESARGRVSAGEGVIGLSWAALVAGARRVVVSQWKVDAASTTDLMTGFYRYLGMPPAGAAADEAEALRSASLDLLRTPRYRHPFYWAAFTVVGG
jgi:CHAT domain-containing protein/tetratricopeptide (TPR) repeat protein